MLYGLRETAISMPPIQRLAQFSGPHILNIHTPWYTHSQTQPNKHKSALFIKNARFNKTSLNDNVGLKRKIWFMVKSRRRIRFRVRRIRL